VEVRINPPQVEKLHKLTIFFRRLSSQSQNSGSLRSAPEIIKLSPLNPSVYPDSYREEGLKRAAREVSGISLPFQKQAKR